jgi:flagellar FliL protein
MSEDFEDSEAPKAGKGKLIIIIIVAALVLLGGGGAAAWFFLLQPKPAPTKAQLAEEKAKSTHFVNLEPFVTNIISQDGETHYVQVTMDLKTDDPKADDEIKTVMPEIRNAVLNRLAGEQASAVSLQTERDRLARQLLLDINHILECSAGDTSGDVITEVDFSGFVMQ